MRVLVTGAAGFAGRHLLEHLRATGDEVVALLHHPAPLPWPDLPVEIADLTDPAATARAVAAAAPEAIVHLAAVSSASRSFASSAETMRHNVVGSASLLAAAAGLQPPPRVIVVGSSEVYGRPTGGPLTEASPLAPVNPYGVSKLAVWRLAQMYWEQTGLPVTEARPFNHLGPGQRRGFVLPDFASQVAAVKLGRQPPVVEVGDLSAARDFTDVRDIVRGYRLLAVGGQAGETYHLCSGQAIPIRTLLDRLAALAEVELEVRATAADQRSDSAGVVVGSHQKIERELGWRPEIGLDRTLADALDEWLLALA